MHLTNKSACPHFARKDIFKFTRRSKVNQANKGVMSRHPYIDRLYMGHTLRPIKDIHAEQLTYQGFHL